MAALVVVLLSAGAAALVSFATVSYLSEEDEAPLTVLPLVSFVSTESDDTQATTSRIYAEAGPRLAFSESSGQVDASSVVAGSGRGESSTTSAPMTETVTAVAASPTAGSTESPVETAAPQPSATATRAAVAATAPRLPEAAAGAIAPVDPCVLRTLTSCPAGVPGIIVGGPEPPPDPAGPADEPGVDLLLLRSLLGRLSLVDFLTGIGEPESVGQPEVGGASGALTASMIVRAQALITAEEVASAADISGCSGPTADSVSFVVGTTGTAYAVVYYWPVARVPLGEPPEARNAITFTDQLVNRPIGGPRYEGCATMDLLRVGVTYEARVQVVSDSGDVEWSPIGQFCLAPCLPSFTIPEGAIEDHGLEVHAWGAYAFVDSPPAPGSLEMFVRGAGSTTWRSSSLLSHYEAGQRLASIPLISGQTYEYRLVLHGDDGRNYESPTGSFTTLRRKVYLTASKFDVVRDGDDSSVGELEFMQLWFSTSDIGCPEASNCQADWHPEGIAISLDGLRGSSPLNDDSIDIDAGTRIEGVPPAELFVGPLTETSYLAVLFAIENDEPVLFGSPTESGHFNLQFSIPPTVGALGSADLSLAEACAFPGASYDLAASAWVTSWYEGASNGPWIQPADARVCVIEMP